MLRSIFLFFKKEPKYFWLFLGVLAFYGFFLLGPRPKEPVRQSSSGVTVFREAEEKWNREMEQAGGFEAFAGREPLPAFFFEVLTAFFILALLAGGAIDALRVWRPSFFQKFRTDLSPLVTRSWPFSILFKAVILFMISGLVLSFLMGTVQALSPKWGSDNYYMILHTLVLDVLCFYFMVRFVKRFGGTWRDLGLRVPVRGFFREVKVGLVGYLGVLPAFAAVVVVLFTAASIFHYEPPAHPLVNIFLEEEKRAPLLMFISVLLGAVIGPFFEEIFFRGFCYPILRDRWGKFWGMVLSAAFFAGIHHSGFIFWPVFVLGIALAYLYEKRHSLVASITLHITHNTLSIAYFFLIKRIIAGS